MILYLFLSYYQCTLNNQSISILDPTNVFSTSFIVNTNKINDQKDFNVPNPNLEETTSISSNLAVYKGKNFLRLGKRETMKDKVDFFKPNFLDLINYKKFQEDKCYFLTAIEEKPPSCHSFDLDKMNKILNYIIISQYERFGKKMIEETSEENRKKYMEKIENEIPFLNFVQHAAKKMICYWSDKGIDINDINNIEVSTECMFPKYIFFSYEKEKNERKNKKTFYAFDFETGNIIQDTEISNFYDFSEEKSLEQNLLSMFRSSYNGFIGISSCYTHLLNDKISLDFFKLTVEDSYNLNLIKNLRGCERKLDNMKKIFINDNVINFLKINGKISGSTTEETKKEFITYQN